MAECCTPSGLTQWSPEVFPELATAGWLEGNGWERR